MAVVSLPAGTAAAELIATPDAETATPAAASRERTPSVAAAVSGLDASRSAATRPAAVDAWRVGYNVKEAATVPAW
jgi:hypothetical protein